MLRAVKIRIPLAKVDIEKGWAPGGKNGVIRGIESGTLVRSACVGYALSFKRVENRADGNAGRPCPARFGDFRAVESHIHGAMRFR